ncbi:MAG: hypothetical protein IPL53_03170 [Ignavibacteria bacterium]|nr:hypothetical protein [Ignavibacteria bacterium]
MKILVYEDTGYKNLYPLNLLRASYDIRFGPNTILQRIECIINNKYEISLHCRNSLVSYLKELYKYKINSISNDDYILLNGRVIFTEDSIKYLISKKEKNSCYIFNNEIVAAYITKDKIQNVKEKIENGDNVFDGDFFEMLKSKSISLKDNFNIRVINCAWDIIDHMIHGGLDDDLNYFLNLKENKKLQRIKNRDSFIEHKRIHISKNVNVLPEVVLDASAGKIIIEENTTIEPFTYIKGPVYIGKNCLIKSGSKVYGPCVIGENSKVAGEIAESVFHSYVNKQHDGFVGHSYICPFVNLGADTVTSDLKNNYSKISTIMKGEAVDTGMQFLGSIIGDHSKTSINTMLNTGTLIGIFANIFGGGFPSKEIESFTWNEAGKKPEKYDIEKAIETAKIVMDRRGIKVSDAYEKLVRSYGE